MTLSDSLGSGLAGGPVTRCRFRGLAAIGRAGNSPQLTWWSWTCITNEGMCRVKYKVQDCCVIMDNLVARMVSQTHKSQQPHLHVSHDTHTSNSCGFLALLVDADADVAAAAVAVDDEVLAVGKVEVVPAPSAAVEGAAVVVDAAVAMVMWFWCTWVAHLLHSWH